jgi:Na+/melibiose symporter-like transporter
VFAVPAGIHNNKNVKEGEYPEKEGANLMAKLKTPKADRLPLGKFLAWKSSDITSAGVFLIVTTYMSIFCTDYLGMSPLVVGNIVLISNVIDFFTDLIAAYVIDNTKSKWGKARPYELGAIGMTLCTTLIFITPSGWNETLKIVWVFCMYTFLFGVFNTFRTSANVPYLIRAFDNNRTLIGKVSSYGGIVTTMGSMVVSLTFPKMMAKLATSDGGWATLILIYMIPLTVLGLLRFIFVKENPSIDAQQVKNKVDFKDIWAMIRKNGYAWLYLLIMFFFQTIQSIAALSYYFKYIVGDVGASGLLSIMSFVLLPTMFLFPVLMKKLSASQIIALGAVFSCMGYIVNFFAGASMTMLIIGGIITAFAMLPISYLGNMVQMDLCTYNQYLGLPRMDASIGALFNGFGTQLGQGFGGWLLGFALTAAGYIASEGDTIVAQPDSAITMIRLLYSLIPMVLMVLLAVTAFILSRLNKKMPEIEAKIAADAAAEAE